MQELTIEGYKHFILTYKNSSSRSFARAFASAFKTDNEELLLIENNDEAREYIFKRYLVH